MKKYVAIAFMALIFLSIESITPKSSEAGVSCKTDYFGNYVCRDTMGNSSTTKSDFFGNDVTNFSNGGRMSCKTDYFGNYVCN